MLKSFNLSIGFNYSEDEMVEKAKRYLPNKDEFSRYKMIDDKVILKPEIKESKCKDAFNGVSILNDGTIGLCCMDIQKYHVFGNLEKNSLTEIMSDEKYLKIWDMALNRALCICKDCSFPGSKNFNKVIDLANHKNVIFNKARAFLRKISHGIK